MKDDPIKSLRGIIQGGKLMAQELLEERRGDNLREEDETAWFLCYIGADIPIAYADCFAIATALLKKAIIVTGDPELEKARHLVNIEWLNRN